jgi:hypothetical protein
VVLIPLLSLHRKFGSRGCRVTLTSADV